mgnify:CR=1 FL=1
MELTLEENSRLKELKDKILESLTEEELKELSTLILKEGKSTLSFGEQQE